MWKENDKNFISLNYNFRKRPMRQKYNMNYIENGALYIFNSDNFLKKNNRLHMKIGTYAMPEIRSLEIDTNDDIVQLKNYLKFHQSFKKKILKNFKN